FKLFSGTSYSGAFTTTLLPSLTAPLSWYNSLAVDGTITVVGPGPTTNANILSVTQYDGTNIVIHGTNNNVPNTSFHYEVLTSTDVTAPLSIWTPIVTNAFGPDGTFTYTNTINSATLKLFYDVKAVP